MKPGIYDISNEQYHNSPGVSRSGIMLFKKSPLHFWNKYIKEDREPEESKQALVFGNALHTHVLEPNEFFNRFAISPDVDRRTKIGKEKLAKFEEENRNKEIIKQETYDEIIEISYSIKNNDFASDLIDKAQYEKTIYWNDPDTNILCKCRPDILHKNMVCDLKTTIDASERAFQGSIYHYGYHIQAAMIQEGLRVALNKQVDDFLFIAVEKSKPYAVAVYILDNKAIEKGREDFKNLLYQYKECSENNSWPSYEQKYITLPSYAFYQ